jgi:dinuclear metal center YbgI/SA1388 family protein
MSRGARGWDRGPSGWWPGSRKSYGAGNLPDVVGGASGSPRLADVVAVLDQLYDPAWAQPWDAVGLVAGDPDAAVRRVLFAVDPVAAVADEALSTGVDLLVTHHPLFLRPVCGVPATTGKGRLLHRLITGGVALHVAHTNADVASPGVSDALAALLGLADLRPLEAAPAVPLDKIVTFVPHPDVERVLDALAAAGAGAIGRYSRCAWTAAGTGTFRPGPRATPAIGRPGEIEVVAESRVEMVLPRERRGAVVDALRAVHPYEEPAYDVFELALPPGPRGLGRVGELANAEPLRAFLARAADRLPATAAGVRAVGDPGRAIRTAAVCGGSGGDLLDRARTMGADVLLTADLRHHPASELAEEGGPALVDAAHWATEYPWLAEAAQLLGAELAAAGTTVEMAVSRVRSDPWTLHLPSPSKEH